MNDPFLASADAYCRALTSAHYENFWVASALVPRDRRRHLRRLYAYCRITDELGDETGEHGRALLLRWREDVRSALEARPSAHPVLTALADTVRRFRLPEQLLLDLVEANLLDQSVHEYASWEQLLGYCRLSAVPVGRLVLRIHECPGPRADALSDDVCIGLQLANFAQDVAVDREKGRTYLPRADILEAGLTGAVERMCDRAATLLASGRELERLVPLRLRLQLALYRLGGQAILAGVRRLGYATDRRRPVVSGARKLALVGTALREAYRA